RRSADVPPPPPPRTRAEGDGRRLAARARELEREIRREKGLRIRQLEFLERLHLGECRDTGRKHAELVGRLVAPDRRDARVLGYEADARPGAEATAPRDDPSARPAPSESSDEAFAAAAALSSMSSRARSRDPIESFVGAEDVEAADGREDLAPSRGGDDVEIGGGVSSCNAAPCSASARESTTDRRMREARPFASTLRKAGVPSTPTKRKMSGVVSDSSSGGEGEEADPSPPSAKRARRAECKRRSRSKTQEKRSEALPAESRKALFPPPDKASSRAKRKKDDKNPRLKKRLPESARRYLKEWMLSPEHCDHPYPSPEEKARIMSEAGIDLAELNNWFVNNRKRFWRNEVAPRISEIKEAARTRGAAVSSKA
ncbi:hypothetical protein ACHAWF_014286, partial [Thalassiosira exigua]